MNLDVYGLSVASDLPLPEVAARTDRPSEVVVALAPEPIEGAWQPFHVAASGEATSWRARARDGATLFRFAGATARVDASEEPTRVLLHPDPHAAPADVRHALLDALLPLVLSLRGVESLHATAVVASGGAIAFAGRAGAGKSTLAAHFLDRGHVVACDDCLALDLARRSPGDERVQARPGYGGLRLRREADKVRRPAAPPGGRLELRRVHVLARGEPARVEDLAPAAALLELIAASHRAATDDRALLERQLRFLERVATLVPVRRLHVPEGLARLDEARAAVLGDLARA